MIEQHATESLANRPAARPELLAPAGDWDAMRAAVVNGADAVYFGLSNFNARYRAANFSLDELSEVMRYLHGHNVRGYVALNTLVFSEELDEAMRFIHAIAEARVDAVIVQDLGIARLIHQMCPGLHVHGSTQMTLTEPLAIEFVRGLGVRRVILARELSVSDIRKIHQAVDMPLEVFVHGALCVSYSGQCLTSEALGGRSANRGQCAQACRLPYELVVDGAIHDLGGKSYLLSPQDLAAYDLIDELADAGVCSFKIEGRLKAGPYVAATTQTYRAAIDAVVSRREFSLPRRQELDLAQTFSRGFSHGFLDGVNHQQLVHARFPKSRGLRIGTVVGSSPRGIVIELQPDVATTNPHGFTTTEELNVGDGVVFDEGTPDLKEVGGRIAFVRPMSDRTQMRRSGKREKSIEISFDRGSVDPDTVSVGATVWKTDDPSVRRRLEASYARDQVARRIGLHATVCAVVGQPLSIVVSDEDAREITVIWDQPLQLAQKHPLTEGSFREQFGRLGDSPFELVGVRGLEEGSQAMVPKSVLNDLRRQAVAQLLQRRDGLALRGVVQLDPLSEARDRIQSTFLSRFPRTDAPRLHVLVRTMDQLSAILDWRSPADGKLPATVYCDFEDIRKYRHAVEQARAAGIAIGLATLRIIKPTEHGLLQQLADCAPDLFLVRNLGSLSFFAKHSPQIPLVGDYALNIANEVTASIFADHGVVRMVPSYDLNWKQLAALLRQFPASAFETVIHQHMPMFHMEHCVFAHALSNGTDFRTCGRPCETHQVDLRDRSGAAHPLIPDVGCRNTVFNAAAQSAAEFVPRMKELGIRHFRIELLREDTNQAKDLLDRYANVIAGKEDGRATWRQLRVLNQLGVTRGTLGE